MICLWILPTIPRNSYLNGRQIEIYVRTKGCYLAFIFDDLGLVGAIERELLVVGSQESDGAIVVGRVLVIPGDAARALVREQLRRLGAE